VSNTNNYTTDTVKYKDFSGELILEQTEYFLGWVFVKDRARSMGDQSFNKGYGE
jgi:hypothetical protein